MEYSPKIQTNRLLLRKFQTGDEKALLDILGDKEVNTFLPMFPLKTLREAREYLEAHYLKKYKEEKAGFYYAICLLSDHDIPIGYIHVEADAPYDLGYGLKKEFWHRGIASEAAGALVDKAKETGFPYITATHDIHNPRSGEVMKKIGMTYQYSYCEQWQPKDFPVIFRMYQLNLDGRKNRVYMGYWNQYPDHFVEKNIL